MGLHVSHLKNLPYENRSLYVYLLDYGWPNGPYEKIFRDNFQAMSQRASETGAIVIASHNGVHFANEVLNWHNVNGLDADKILPAILVTKTHPNYFTDSYDDDGNGGEGLGDIVLIPLKRVCTNPDDFASVIESVFSDLEKGLELSKFRVSEHDSQNIKPTVSAFTRFGTRIGKSIMLEPNFAGFGVNLKTLFENPQ